MRMPVSVIWFWMDFHERTTVKSSRWLSGIGGRCAARRRRTPGAGVGPTSRCDRPTQGSQRSRSATAPAADSDGRRLPSCVSDAVVPPSLYSTRTDLQQVNPVPDWDGCYWRCSIRSIQEIGPRPPTRKVLYDTRCYFNVRSKADISQLNLPHGTDN